jgi:hypothetical protein
MDLDLKDGWLYLGIRPNISDQSGSHIADTNSLDHTLFLKSLHGSPCLVHWYQINENFAISFWMVIPEYWVFLILWNVLERYWEMNQIEVDIFETKVIKAPLAGWFNVLFSMICIPELSGDKEIFPLDDALINGPLDTLTTLLLVTVYGCLIN